jgi:hypothetical protein
VHVVYLILRHKIDRSVSFLHETDCLLYYSKKRLVFLQRMLIHFAKSALLLVGVQHEVALGGIECAISGMTVAVVKNGGTLYADVITT